jgi:hypothetical protein
MDGKKDVKKLSMSSTKQEMLSAYGELLKQLQEKQAGELKPEKMVEEKKTKEAVQVAESLTSESVAKEINNLKLDVNRMLAQLSDRLDIEVNKFLSIRDAISARERELQELYEIEKSAMTLAALIEAQNLKRQEFASEMEGKKEALDSEIKNTRYGWLKEKEAYEAAVKERDAAEKKRQTREKEEFDYNFKREQQLATDRYQYEKAKLEQELKDKKEALENELKARETAIAEKEEELAELRKRAVQFPKELEAAVNRAVKETTERITFEAKAKEELLKKESEGERNVLNTRIDALEKTIAEQSERMTRISQQLEDAYQKVQDIAVKTVEGASNTNSLSNLQQLIGEQLRKQTSEK